MSGFGLNVDALADNALFSIGYMLLSFKQRILKIQSPFRKDGNRICLEIGKDWRVRRIVMGAGPLIAEMFSFIERLVGADCVKMRGYMYFFWDSH